MAYNVKQGPVQVITSPGPGVNLPLNFGPAFLEDPSVPFFITIHNEGGGEIFLVRIGELDSGYVAHTGDSVTAGPYLLENAQLLEIHFTAGGGNGFVTYTSVLEEI